MRILFVCSYNSIYNEKANPYVASLIDGLRNIGRYEIKCGLSYFWNDFSSFDILFFQWPECIFDWNIGEIDIEKISYQLDLVKKAGVKTVITCHNLYPHNRLPIVKQLYDLVYSKVDAFHHMGNHSFQLMKSQYPNTFHFIAPHHIADRFFNNTNQSYARNQLNIPPDCIVIASYGAFRSDKEKKLFLDMVDDTKNSNINYLAPRLTIGKFFNGQYAKTPFSFIKKWFIFLVKKIRTSCYLDEERMKQWLSATDIVFIQRTEILNSGNVPLAFAAGKVVVGPCIGNVGVILRETNNFLFKPDDRKSVKKAIQNAIEEIKKGNKIGKNNYTYAKRNWTVPTVSKTISYNLEIIVKQ